MAPSPLKQSHHLVPYSTLVLDQFPPGVEICTSAPLRYILNAFYLVLINYLPPLVEDRRAYMKIVFQLSFAFIELERIASLWGVDKTDGRMQNWSELCFKLCIKLFMQFPEEAEYPEILCILQQYIDNPKGDIEGMELIPNPKLVIRALHERKRQAGVQEAQLILVNRSLYPEKPARKRTKRRSEEGSVEGTGKSPFGSPPKNPSKLRYSFTEEEVEECDSEDWVFVYPN
ncbi:hypothetical protein CVT24_000346 [Panaeolus cyanescens]|uniref:Uncharacterized protein n=1 Tax=Panaeolus cyanescens TaxID=181874 RepID=A0A409YD41_9AGAR|nr:hypothetical protein CVT24_000346 [Panaeolus cyanescens]